MLDVSQNSVWLMSTTSVPRLYAAASSRTARSRAALVMSISSHVVTTGTPVTIATGNPASGMRVILSEDLAPDHEQRDVVACGLAADEGSYHRGTGRPRELCRYRPAQPGQAVIDQLAGPLDQAISVKTQQSAGRDRHGTHRALHVRGNPDHQASPDAGQFRRPPR